LGGVIFGASPSMSYKPVVIIGPSGAGKSSIVKVLCEKYKFTIVKTFTTREQRDPSDTDHIFISSIEFETMKNNSDFFGTLDIFGSHYGLPEFNADKKTVVLLRAPAVEEFLLKFPDADIIEVDAPMQTLESRLQRRGSSERFIPKALEEEIAWGRSLARITINSSLQTVDEIARSIAMEYRQ